MDYINTRDTGVTVSFREAIFDGLAGNRGLYMPSGIPVVDRHVLDNIDDLDDRELAAHILYPYVEGSLGRKDLEHALARTLSFPIPVVKVERGIYCLELFHGPTQSFKDVGARFMASCLSRFVSHGQDITVIVATSGDTGSAVASAFQGAGGIRVVILFPRGLISPYQEYQITSQGKNITAIEVDGSFDDCQALVKQALDDTALKGRMQLCTANSINVARLLPQMVYYFLAYKQIRKELGHKRWIVSVPSGNFGNLTAGLMAMKMGLPVHRFVAACNSNDTFYRYLESGRYEPRPTVATISNAMDVGAPSNFERIMHLFGGDHEEVRNSISSHRFDDRSTLKEMRTTYERAAYLTDPHGAVGLAALREQMDDQSVGLFLETAHPRKFVPVVRRAVPSARLEVPAVGRGKKTCIAGSYGELAGILLRKGN